MNHIKALALNSPAPLAPAGVTTTMVHPTHSRRVNLVQKPRGRPSEHPDPVVQHRAGGLIGTLAAGTVLVDYAARALGDMGLFRHEAKYQLGMLSRLTDKLLVAMQDQFDMEDADATNHLSSALGLLAERFCQLTPAQMDAALRHMDEMCRLNLAYIPAPTPTTTTRQ